MIKAFTPTSKRVIICQAILGKVKAILGKVTPCLKISLPAIPASLPAKIFGVLLKFFRKRGTKKGFLLLLGASLLKFFEILPGRKLFPGGRTLNFVAGRSTDLAGSLKK